MTPALNKALPEFEALATGGIKFTPQAFAGRIVVLYFYPKDNTPGCTTEAMQFRDKYKDQTPVETGDMRQAIGELVTCSRCIGTWVAAALAATQILMPRFGRILTWSLAAAGMNDWLQAGFTALTSKSNELEQRAESS